MTHSAFGLLAFFGLPWLVCAQAYYEMIPASAGLPFDPAVDVMESFKAPDGRTIQVLVKGPEGSGTYSREMRPEESADEYFPAVVQEAVQAKAHHLVIPKGTYLFKGPATCDASAYYTCKPHWTIGAYPQDGSAPTNSTFTNSLSDLDIDFSGSELDFSAPDLGIWILNTQRLRLRNFTMDWPALPIASTGTVVVDPYNAGHNALLLDPQYPVEDRYQNGPVQIQAVDIWDEVAGVFDAKSNNNFETYFIFGNAPQPTYAGGHLFSCKSCNFQNSPADPTCNFFQGCANFDGYAVGTRLIVRHYTYNGFALLVNWSNDVTLENVKLRTGPGMGIALGNNGGFRGFRLANSEVERGPGRLISTASDAINLGGQADIIVEGNNIAHQGDDSINIHSSTGSINSAKDKEVIVPGPCSPSPTDGPVEGDLLAFFDTNFVYRSMARVVSVSGYTCATLTLKMDREVGTLDNTYSYLDVTQQPSARYLVRGNVMHDCRCHGLWVNAPYGAVENNTMFHNSEGAIGLAGGSGNGPGSTNMAIIKNVFKDPGQWAQYYGAISMVGADASGNLLNTPVFERLNIGGNTFETLPGPALVMTAAQGLSITNNSIVSGNLAQTNPFFWGNLPTIDSILLENSSHGVICGTRRDGTTTGPIGVDASDQLVLIEPNCGVQRF